MAKGKQTGIDPGKAGSMGAWWKRKTLPRGKRKKGGGKAIPKSQTPGLTKAENCHASVTDKYICSRNRSWKHPDYDAWCEKVDKARKVKR